MTHKLVYKIFIYLGVFILTLFIQHSIHKKNKIIMNSSIDYFKIPIYVLVLICLIDLYHTSSDNYNLYEYDHIFNN
jgi:hypothetical protein